MKKILITGGNAGLAIEISRLMAIDGCQIVLIGTDDLKLMQVVEELPGNKHRYLHIDLLLEDDFQRLINLLKSEYFDVLINADELMLFDSFEDAEPEVLSKMIILNVTRMVTLSHQFIQKAGDGAALVNVGSIFGLASCTGAAVYAASKAFVATFSASLWAEARSKNVFVCSFNPGMIRQLPMDSAKAEPANSFTQDPKNLARMLYNQINQRKKISYTPGILGKAILLLKTILGIKAATLLINRLSPLPLPTRPPFH